MGQAVSERGYFMGGGRGGKLARTLYGGGARRSFGVLVVGEAEELLGLRFWSSSGGGSPGGGGISIILLVVILVVAGTAAEVPSSAAAHGGSSIVVGDGESWG